MKAYKNNTAKSSSLQASVSGQGVGLWHGRRNGATGRNGITGKNGAAVVFVLALLLSVSTAVSTVFAQEEVFLLRLWPLRPTKR